MVNADKIKLSHRAKQGNRGARLVLQLFKRPERMLTTTLIGTNISTVVLTTLGTLMMIHFFGNELGDFYAFLVFTPLLLILGEIVPKEYLPAGIGSDCTGRRLSASWICMACFRRWSCSFHKSLDRPRGWWEAAPLRITCSSRAINCRSVMEMAERASDTTVFDRFRIERAIRFPETTVGEEMVPVVEMVAIDNEKTTADAVELVRRRGFNRLPAYQGDTNNVVGIVTLDDVGLDGPDRGEASNHRVDSSQHTTFLRMIRWKNYCQCLRDRDDQMAIVVDEYGSTVGMITMEDLVEVSRR